MKNLFKNFALVIGIVAIFVVGLFAFSNYNTNSISTVKADSVITTYQSSGILCRYSLFSNSTGDADYNNLVSSDYLRFIVSFANGNVTYSLPMSSNGVISGHYTFTESLQQGTWHLDHLNIFEDYLILAVYVTPNFDYNVNRIDVGDYDESAQNIHSNTFIYYNASGEYASFSLRYYNSGSQISTDLYSNSNRTYFLLPNYSNNDYYNLGLKNGRDEGFQDGLNDDDNNQSNYDRGYNYGKSIGYNQGLADANQYTFMSLIGAVIDTPIQTFISCFNFNLLGINLKDFFFALLSLAVVIFVVRFILARR